ncbi:protein-disulfide isomerase [Litoreibacter halocynthiae]|uniref:Protein-disulfide isomerase n=1 Tax=Litoreibacter halocynthiae TaxID=1242689 RepID=A0A4R7LN35_9RHOB|nr:DsbA family protein [Litoreibacter halocynthiae]TDT77438.1 protein-disulfide isomerase [Litoreibacter halocynthiae]
MIRFATSTALALCLVATSASAEDLSRAQMQELVLETIRENPEIVMEALQTLQARKEEADAAQAQSVLSANRAVLERDPNAPVLGNPDGDVTVVEFFDYNCGYCRRTFDDVHALIRDDTNVRVVMREWPILGEESVYAARAALASRSQGKYEAFHNALMRNEGRANEASVIRIAEELGMDIEQLKQDMDAPEVVAHIQTSMQLTRALDLNGTPAFIFGDQIAPGAIELDQMKDLVAQIRDAG